MTNAFHFAGSDVSTSEALMYGSDSRTALASRATGCFGLRTDVAHLLAMMLTRWTLTDNVDWMVSRVTMVIVMTTSMKHC